MSDIVCSTRWGTPMKSRTFHTESTSLVNLLIQNLHVALTLPALHLPFSDKGINDIFHSIHIIPAIIDIPSLIVSEKGVCIKWSAICSRIPSPISRTTLSLSPPFENRRGVHHRSTYLSTNGNPGDASTIAGSCTFDRETWWFCRGDEVEWYLWLGRWGRGYVALDYVCEGYGGSESGS